MSLSSTPPAIPSESSSGDVRPGLFESTSWSEVLAARDKGAETHRPALEKLCATYWPPLHAYVRRKISDEHLAEDLTQSFFERLLTGKSLKFADPARGRFRTFLIQSLEWHLANEFREGKAVKRGGRIRVLNFDFSFSEFFPQGQGDLSPEEHFEREWALTLLKEAIHRLQAEQSESEEGGRRFEILKVFLTGERPEETYASVCEKLQISESAARMAVTRLRARYRFLLREEILKTVSTTLDVEDEIRELFRALSRR